MDPNKKQKTLFQVWKKKENTDQETSVRNPSNSSKAQPFEPIVIDDDSDSGKFEIPPFEDEDEMLVRALELSMEEYVASQKKICYQTLDALQPKEKVHLSVPDSFESLTKPSTSRANFSCPTAVLPKQIAKETIEGFDTEAGQTWIYPTNYSFREYQFNIVKSSLFKNTMVVLPTGLGKTFIAAVIMYNFYRWYPQGKVIFMAPTRPLVNQQIEACFKIMGIPQSDTEVMLGSDAPEKRKQKWLSKRAFFLTPQVIMNDISRGVCPVDGVKCLVVDEAHKAQGNHAYCEVIRGLLQASMSKFRVIGLSATPGGDLEAVQSVIKNLLISNLELRSEDSPDIVPYTHVRKISKVVVKMDEELLSVREKFLKVLKYLLVRLEQKKAINKSVNPESLTQFGVLKLKEAFNQNPPQNITKASFSMIQLEFLVCITLYHAYDLLCVHGTRTFYKYMKGNLSGEKSQERVAKFLENNADFQEVFMQLREKHESKDSGTIFPYGHPKLKKLEEIVLSHFHRTLNDKNESTRVMIFSNYRESVEEIVEMLQKHDPIVRAMAFVGQNNKGGKGITQKVQIQVVENFRKGGYNTLVSTCVGEEGLDIGEIDLIICYDAHKSPIRLVQRIGRTGRKRDGEVISLVTEGKEEQVIWTFCY